MPDDRAPVTPGSERAAGEAAAAAGPPATAPPPAAAGAPPTTTPSSAEASSTTPPPGPSAPAAAPPPARPGRARGRSIAAALAAAAVVLAALAVAVRTGEENVITGPPPPPALADAVPFDGRSPREPAAEGTRVLVALPRPALGATTIRDPAKQRRYVASLKDESRALRSALGARAIQLSRVVTFERTFDGFAATVRTRDLARLDSLGVRVRPVRRFYPATSEPVRIPGASVPGAPPAVGGLPVAVLASGVERRHPLLKGRLDRGRDVVDTDDDPSPTRDPRGGRRESSGTALAGVLAAAGERVLPIRIAGLQPAAQGTGLEEVALSDQLLAGFERAVDPNGDGATDDHVTVALVGVNAPYAGFGDSAEARAVEHAQELGTLVVAPAGDEGPGAGAQGTIGSPGAAPDALTVGALAAPAAVPRVRLTIGDAGVSGAALLAGGPPPDDLETGPVVRADAAPPRRALRGRLAVVEAGNTPVARAAAAAAAGARAVLLAEPRPRRPLPALPGGRVGIPVAGVTGAGARIALAARPGTQVDVGEAQPAQVPDPTATGDAAPAVSPFSSRGPAADGALKPDLAAPGAALTAVPGRGGAVVGGSAIAAAEAAVEAARLARLRPDASPGQLRASLTAAAQGDPAPPVRGAGAGVLRAPPVGAALTAFARDPRRGDPCPGSRPCTRIVIVNRSATGVALDLAVAPDAGASATVSPAGLLVPAAARREAEVQVVGARGRLAAGRLEVSTAGQVVLVHPFGIRTAAPAPPPLGPLRLERGGKGAVTGVRFALGAFALGDPLGRGTAVRLASRLDLTLVSPGTGAVVERLTPFAGARELLPAEYAYRVPADTLAGLASGTYAFRATARSPAGGRPAVETSRAFRR